MFNFFSIDGTSTKTLIIFANDNKDNPNCIARSIKTDSNGVQGPFICTKRTILSNEEITYSYGKDDYEWRTNKQKNGTVRSDVGQISRKNNGELKKAPGKTRLKVPIKQSQN